MAGLSQKRQPTRQPVVEGGPGHGCGHNLLGTAGLAAAVAVARWLKARAPASGSRAEQRIQHLYDSDVFLQQMSRPAASGLCQSQGVASVFRGKRLVGCLRHVR